MRIRLFAIVLLIATFGLAGCASSRYDQRSGQYGAYGNNSGVYSRPYPGVYNPRSRDYRLERRREREEMQRRQREERRRDRHRNRSSRDEQRRNR
jgi:hypothetical protein